MFIQYMYSLSIQNLAINFSKLKINVFVIYTIHGKVVSITANSIEKLWLKGGVGVAVRGGLLLSGYLYLPCIVFLTCIVMNCT